ncbi:Glycosyl transferase family group 2 [Desulforhopalus singaporensis]|uniref:Glycosyl transferase family group 2 n=1 Tax=Desulforhopalus singaporensis TaxID=91360 RepID=A0A1H0LU36_9BACT|nr:Glycosyl transferase family group 2 [Desulforhopalus singaporensis]
MHAEYNGFFHIGMITRNERNAIIQHGTMTMVRYRVMQEVNGWSEWCITEDAELGLRIFERGYEAAYVAKSYGQGLMPDTFLDFKKQRFRWAYGAMLIMRHHLASLLGLKKTCLTRGQRYHFLAGWLPWIADGVNLLFNLGALTWTTLMILRPGVFNPPEAMFSMMPIVFFCFKVLKMFVLYRWRIKAGHRQCLAAGLAGLALSHTIARAMVAGFLTKGIGFFRTPKMTSKNKIMQALSACREELLFATALLLGSYILGRTQDMSLFDLRMWRVVLVIQSIPFLAAIIVSITGALPKIPASLIGHMKPIDHYPATDRPQPPPPPIHIESPH